MTLICDIYFDGEIVAHDVEVGWKDNTVRSCDIGGNNMCYIIDGELISTVNDDDSVNYSFTYIDNTNTRPGRPHLAGIRSNRILDDMGYHSSGLWGIDVKAR